MDFESGDVLVVKKTVKVGTVETGPSAARSGTRTLHGHISLDPGARLFFVHRGGTPCGSDDFSIRNTFRLEDDRFVQVSYCRLDYMEEHFELLKREG